MKSPLLGLLWGPKILVRVTYVLSIKGELKLAVDVGCGSGMSTVNLFGKFQKILGKIVEKFKIL